MKRQADKIFHVWSCSSRRTPYADIWTEKLHMVLSEQAFSEQVSHQRGLIPLTLFESKLGVLRSSRAAPPQPHTQC